MPEATWPCSDLDASRPSLQRRDLCPGVPQVRLHETAKYLYAQIPSSTYTGKATRTFVPLQHRNVKFDYVLLPRPESSSTRRPYCTKYIYPVFGIFKNTKYRDTQILRYVKFN
ncbi:hypothetical protein TRIUR3_29484 [Triticum urartu]|uniref:Uncharacterized protein n=1 Tax=Triticum urartu TaxID=4572 RepID=M7YPX0_TRIUA|nr:hypothetical protein TRIUR3_29484 [Triticum urartu]